MSVIMKMKNSNTSLNGYKKTRRTALTESSEINKTSHNIVNNPLVESFFSQKNFTSDLLKKTTEFCVIHQSQQKSLRLLITKTQILLEHT